MTKNDCLYDFAHRHLKELFYTRGDRMLKAFMDSSFYSTEWTRFLMPRLVPWDNSYTADDFPVKSYYMKEIRGVLVRVSLPDATDNLLCRRIYMIFRNYYSKPAYFIEERNYDGEYCLFGMLSGNHRIGFGTASDDAEKEVRHVLRIYKKWPGILSDTEKSGPGLQSIKMKI